MFYITFEDQLICVDSVEKNQDIRIIGCWPMATFFLHFTATVKPRLKDTSLFETHLALRDVFLVGCNFFPFNICKLNIFISKIKAY